MKTKVIITVVVYALFSVIIFNACCKKKTCNDPSNAECENYDPCYNKTPNANFQMRSSIWDVIKEKFFDESELVPINDTIYAPDYTAKLDFIPSYRGNNSTKYYWKIDGMSTVFTKQDLPYVNFGSYLARVNLTADSIFYKPLGITLTVTEPFSDCNKADTVYKLKKYITFSRGNTYEGWYTGYFSTDPNKEVNIFMGEMYDTIPPFDYYPTLYVNFPFCPDTAAWTGTFSTSSLKIQDYRSYSKRIWALNELEPYDSTTFGIVSFNLQSDFDNINKRNKIKFTYGFKDKITQKNQLITFNGYQTKFFKYYKF